MVRFSSGLKTDAPFNVVWDFMRCWVKEHPIVGEGPRSASAPGAIILSKEPTLNVCETPSSSPPPSILAELCQYPKT